MPNIYNTLTRQKQPLVPIKPNEVGIYVCGMTVYDYCHVGHARVMVVFDVVVRYLRHLGLKVNYVSNITDIDDKIIQRANENGENFNELTNRFIQAMHADSDALGVLRPDTQPRATQFIPEIIAMIQALLDNNHAYITDSGDVCYSVQSFANYGKLSGKKLEELRAGERVNIDESKQNSLDFVLWKVAKPNEPSWDSPWGDGRPGWHIECSAMSTVCLGSNHFDIHGGGMDLQFPHHENEIAQSEGTTGEKFVNIWMHNGFVRINDEKMSKSLGNFFTVREVLKKYQPEVLRYFILTSHYRSPLNYSDADLDSAKQALTRLYTALRGLSDNDIGADNSYKQRFQAVMDDDFNTPEALAILFELSHEINKARVDNASLATQLANELKQLGSILGLLQDDPEVFLQGIEQDCSAIEQLIADRKMARQQRNWAEADRIRDELQQQGIVLEDNANGTTWRKV